eukprot:TRINITY_DN28196_c0_g1_i1.p1 TRINITY_DN28196_c0_g1~~TRINITY_DN28196_c0_g1_i1.p1  ORF type:complete len:717 (+),score=182.88 TRINITY_DN28196_c0_g1_i1:126-2153(+)
MPHTAEREGGVAALATALRGGGSGRNMSPTRQLHRQQHGLQSPPQPPPEVRSPPPGAASPPLTLSLQAPSADMRVSPRRADRRADDDAAAAASLLGSVEGGGEAGAMLTLMGAVERCRRTGREHVPLAVMEALAQCCDALAADLAAARRREAEACAEASACRAELTAAQREARAADEARAAVTAALNAEMEALRAELQRMRERLPPSAAAVAAGAAAAAGLAALLLSTATELPPPPTAKRLNWGMLFSSEPSGRAAVAEAEAQARRRLARVHRRSAIPFGKEGCLSVAVRGPTRTDPEPPVVLCRVCPDAHQAGLRAGDLVVRVGTPCGEFPVSTRGDFLRAIGPRARVFEGVEVSLWVLRDPGFAADWRQRLRDWSGGVSPGDDAVWLPRVATLPARQPQEESPKAGGRPGRGRSALSRGSHPPPPLSPVKRAPSAGNRRAAQPPRLSVSPPRSPRPGDRGPPPTPAPPPHVLPTVCVLRVGELTDAALDNRLHHLREHGRARFGRHFDEAAAFAMQSDPKAWLHLVRSTRRSSARVPGVPASPREGSPRSTRGQPISCSTAERVCRALAHRLGCSAPGPAAVQEAFASFDADRRGALSPPELALLARELLMEEVFGEDAAAAPPAELAPPDEGAPAGPSPAHHRPDPHQGRVSAQQSRAAAADARYCPPTPPL